MRRAKALSVAVVALVALVFGAAVVHAGWEWNAKVNVENTIVRTIWSVNDDVSGGAGYSASIKVTLPEGANASVVEVASNETVKLTKDDDLSCGPGGIEAKISYKVSPLNGAIGTQVAVTIATDSGQLLGEGTGQVGEKISVRVLVPGSCG